MLGCLTSEAPTGGAKRGFEPRSLSRSVKLALRMSSAFSCYALSWRNIATLAHTTQDVVRSPLTNKQRKPTHRQASLSEEGRSSDNDPEPGTTCATLGLNLAPWRDPNGSLGSLQAASCATATIVALCRGPNSR